MSVKNRVGAIARTAGRHDLAIALPFGALVAYLVGRGIYFTPGWIQYSADFTIHTDVDVQRQMWSSAWNSFVGEDNVAYLSMSPFWLTLLAITGTAGAQKLFLFIIWTLAAAFSFLLVSWWAKSEFQLGRKAACSLGALTGFVYVVNPWVAIESVHPFYLWLYALLPVTIWLMCKALVEQRRKRQWALMLGVGAVAVLTGTAYGIAFHMLVALVFLISHTVANRRDGWPAVGRSLSLLAFALAAVFALSLYSIVPALTSNFSNGTSWALFTTESMYILSKYTPAASAVRGLFDPSSAQLIEPVVGSLKWLIPVVSLIVVVLVALRWFTKGWNRRDTSLAGIALVALIMANGTNWPTGDLYARLAQNPPFSAFSFVVFKGPYKLVPLVVAALLFLAIRGLLVLFARSSKTQRGYGVAGVAMLLVWAVVMGSPMLTGDLNGYLRPVKPPANFGESLNAIDSSKGRSIWLPTDTTGLQQPNWAPERAYLDLIGGNVPSPAMWLAESKTSSRGTAYSPPAPGRVFDQYVASLIRAKSSVDIGRFMQMSGRNYIVVQRDVGSSAEDFRLALRDRKDFRAVSENEHLAIFEPVSDKTVPASSRYTLSMGGYEHLLGEVSRENPTTTVMAADVPLGKDGDHVREGASRITFPNGIGWRDIALNDWGSQLQSYDLVAAVKYTQPLSGWNKDFYESNTWVPFKVAAINGAEYGPSQFGPFLETASKARVSVNAKTAIDDGEFWVHAFVSKESGPLALNTRDHQFESVNTRRDPSVGWTWIKVADRVSVRTGDNLQVEMSGGQGAIDRAILVKPGEIETATDEVKRKFEPVPVAVSAPWAALPAASDSGSERRIEVPRDGRYRVGVTLSGDNGWDGARVNDTRLEKGSNDGAFVFSNPIDLKTGENKVVFPNGVPTSLIVEQVDIQSAGARELQTFSEPFHPLWTAGSATHVRINGSLNGFISEDPVDPHFSANKLVNIGRGLSVLAAIALGVLAHLLWHEKRLLDYPVARRFARR